MSLLSKEELAVLRRAQGQVSSLLFRIRLIQEHEPDTPFWILDNLRHALLMATDSVDELRSLIRARAPMARKPVRSADARREKVDAA